LEFNRENLGGGVAFSRVTDKKFKSCSVKISFITENSYESSAKSALLFSILATSNAKLPSRTALTEAAEELYGSYISSFCSRLGDYITAGLECGFIADGNTIGKEVISTKAVDILLDCIFDPQLEGGLLSEEYFLMKQKELCDAIAASVNNKRAYAVREARKLIFKGEPAMYSDHGSIEDAMNITREDLSEHLSFLLENAVTEISVSSDGSTAECEKMIKDRFAPFTKRDIKPITYRKNSPLKAEPAFAEVAESINQSKMVMAFKSAYDDIYTVKLFSTMFGGAPFSMLFENVREKLSLCYYCPSAYIDTKGTMIVDSGVENSNLDAARDEIIRQLQQAAEGAFSDELLENSKRFICDSFMSNYDSPYNMQDWYSAQVTRGTAFSPDEICEKLNAVTREQIRDCAASFRLDTVFTVKATGEAVSAQ
jgi:predicted Zn-dependent peptidase